MTSLVIAGGVNIIERQADLTTAQENILKAAGVTDVSVSELVCNDEYCTYWITKKGVINKQIRIDRYKEVCIVTKDGSYDKEGVEIEAPIVECNRVEIKAADLTKIRDKEVDMMLGTIAQTTEDTKSEIKIGNEELVRVGK